MRRLANYGELIPAAYGNYVFENKDFEVEAGVRVEYVQIKYNVNPNIRFTKATDIITRSRSRTSALPTR